MIRYLLLCGVTLIGYAPMASADFMYDFVRISCIQETRFFDIEHRRIHNSAVDTELETSSKDKFTKWAKHGFYEPSNLFYKCKFPNAEYKLVTRQSEWSNGMCGAAPELFLDLYRNGELLVKNVVFGDSCFGNASITRISILEEQKGEFLDEAEICFKKNSQFGGASGKRNCEWIFGSSQKKKFPLDQNSIMQFIPEDSGQVGGHEVPTR